MHSIEKFVELAKTVPLDAKGNVRLWSRATKGNLRARENLLRGNIRFAIHLAKSYHRFLSRADIHVTLEELIEAGLEGLNHTIDKWDPKKGTFLTLAGWHVRKYLREAWQDGLPVHIPHSHVAAHLRLAKWKMCNRSDCEAASVSTNLPYKEVQNLLPFCGLKEVDEYIVEEIDDTVFEDVEKQELLTKALEHLTDKQRDIITKRFGLNCESQTLEEIAIKKKITRERVRQIEAKALRRLRCIVPFIEKEREALATKQFLIVPRTKLIFKKNVQKRRKYKPRKPKVLHVPCTVVDYDI